MKGAIHKEEWYPVWEIETKEDSFLFRKPEYAECFIELSNEFYKKYTRIMQEFDDLQIEIQSLVIK